MFRWLGNFILAASLITAAVWVCLNIIDEEWKMQQVWAAAAAVVFASGLLRYVLLQMDARKSEAPE